MPQGVAKNFFKKSKIDEYERKSGFLESGASGRAGCLTPERPTLGLREPFAPGLLNSQLWLTALASNSFSNISKLRS